MRKILFPVILLLSLQAGAQNFQPGIKGGVNISNFHGGDFGDIETKALVGFHAGGFFRFRFGNLALQPELLFSTQGAQFESAGEDIDYKVSYVNVPILLQFYTNGGFFVEAGPQVGFKVSEDIPDQTIKDFAKSTDLSIAAGLGYQSSIGLGIGARYNIGVSKVGDFDSNNIDPDFRNGVIMLSVFYTLFNKKDK